jgi:hypothetical protein
MYEIRFGFHTWRTAYNFDIHLVPTSDSDIIETYLFDYQAR